MNYKKECESYFEDADHNIKRTKHEMDKEMKKLSKQYQDRKSEYVEHGDEWFYFEYVEKVKGFQGDFDRIKFNL